jgi:WD40 repeat protein
VDGVAYSADGTTAAAAWQDGVVRIWRVSDPLRPALIATLRVRAGGIDSLAFSPDGGLLAVHALGSLELWKLDSGPGRPVLLSDTPVPEVVPYPKGDPPWLPVAFGPGGRTVATGAGDGRFRIWDIADPPHPLLMATVTDSSRPLTAVSFSPDGSTLAVSSENSNSSGEGGQVRLWDVRDPAKPVPGSALSVSSALSVAFSPVGHLLVAVGSNDDVYAWNVASTSRPAIVQVDKNNSGNAKSLYSVAFHPGSDEFLTADSGGQTEIWTDVPGQGISDTDGGELPDSSAPNSVAFSPSGEQIITGGFGGSVKLWTALAPLLQGYISTGSGGSPYNGNGTVMLTEDPVAGDPSPIELWDVSNPFHPVRDAVIPGTWTAGASFLPDSNTLATLAAGGRVIQLWNVTDPRHPKAGAELSVDGTEAYIPLTWNASSNGLLLIADPDDVRIWDVRNDSHPVLESTINVTPYGDMGFLSNQLVAVNVKPSPTESELELWNIANPRHPVAEGQVPNGDPESAILDVPSLGLLTETTTGSISDTSLWSLKDLSKPLIPDANMDPSSVNGLNGDLLIALTGDRDTMDVLNLGNPRKPIVTAALPVGSGYASAGVYTTDSPAGWLAGANFISSNGIGQVINLMRVSGDGKALSDYAQLPSPAGSLFTFSPDGKVLATNFDTSDGSGFGAFYPQNPDYLGLGMLYPLNSDSLYEHLCSIATQTPVNPTWSKYLPTTYYRPACS